MGGVERARKIIEQIGKVSRQRCRPRDQNIVMPLPPQKGQKLRRSSPQTALGAVAGDGVADLAAGGEAHANGLGENGFSGRFRLGCDLQDQTGRGPFAPDRGHAQKIGAPLQAADG